MGALVRRSLLITGPYWEGSCVEVKQPLIVPFLRGDRVRDFCACRYTLVRGLTLVITVIIGVYLAILIANGGGYVDKIREGQIREQISLSIAGNEALRDMTMQERREYEQNLVAIELSRRGLDQPFMVRSFRYLWNGLTLDLGSAEYLLSDSGLAKYETS